MTLPGSAQRVGAEHPLVKTMAEIVSVFQRMGYSVGLGPEVETDFYNFEALNFPPNHPARDTQDTLVVAGQEGKPLRERLLMRTHTSPVQIRSMLEQAPPLRLVIPGKVHRNDAADATHSPVFHQVEGLCVDTNITFSDLKGTLDHAMKAFFGSAVKTRFFPSFFPFTEPSARMCRSRCIFCGGKGCRKCKHSGWIELLGCGMVDPAVFEAVNQRRVEMGREPVYDTRKISGFAFGMGVDRIAMMKYGISDIGLLYSGDMRFLEQFAWRASSEQVSVSKSELAKGGWTCGRGISKELLVWQRAMEYGAAGVSRCSEVSTRMRCFGCWGHSCAGRLCRCLAYVRRERWAAVGPVFRMFLAQARGSLDEVETQLMLAADLGYIADDDAMQLQQMCDEVAYAVMGC